MTQSFQNASKVCFQFYNGIFLKTEEIIFVEMEKLKNVTRDFLF